MAFKLAFKLPAFKLPPLPFRGRVRAAELQPGGPAPAAPTPQAAGAAKPLPLIGRLSSARQLQILTSVLVLLLVVDAAIVTYDTRQSTFDTLYIATAGKMR